MPTDREPDQASPEQERPLRAGVVTQLRAQAKNPDRVSVYLDGRFAFGLYQDIVLQFGLYKGRRLEVDEQQRLLEADQLYIARSKALHYLAYRARSEQEVRRKLGQGGFSEGVVDEVIARLETLGYLDDAAYAEGYARRRFETGGYGPRRVRNDLMRRGVGRADIEAALAKVFDEEDDVIAAAREQAGRRWSRLAREEDPLKRRKKVYDFLLRRGFSYDVIQRVVDEIERGEDDG